MTLTILYGASVSYVTKGLTESKSLKMTQSIYVNNKKLDDINFLSKYASVVIEYYKRDYALLSIAKDKGLITDPNVKLESLIESKETLGSIISSNSKQSNVNKYSSDIINLLAKDTTLTEAETKSITKPVRIYSVQALKFLSEKEAQDSGLKDVDSFNKVYLGKKGIYLNISEDSCDAKTKEILSKYLDTDLVKEPIIYNGDYYLVVIQSIRQNSVEVQLNAIKQQKATQQLQVLIDEKLKSLNFELK